jgi:hypothetical protein
MIDFFSIQKVVSIKLEIVIFFITNQSGSDHVLHF